MNTGENTMPKLTKEWQPSQEVINQYKEVNHDREIKYFKHFYITNQYDKQDWNTVYCEWCKKQLNRKNTGHTSRIRPKQSNESDSFYLGVYNQLKDN